MRTCFVCGREIAESLWWWDRDNGVAHAYCKPMICRGFMQDAGGFITSNKAFLSNVLYDFSGHDQMVHDSHFV